MPSADKKIQRLKRRRHHIRRSVKGTAARPRLMVRRSLKHIYAQIIDDASGKTLCAVSSASLDVSGGNVEGAKAVGTSLAGKAKEASVDKVCFDRNGRLYHGRIKALADAAREGGLEF
jgi:large subunit ribosomal protein L18